MSTVTCENGDTHAVDEDNFLVDGVLVKVTINDLVGTGGLEGFLDLISGLAGFPLLMQQTYEVEGSEGEYILLRVRGDVSECAESK